MLKRFVIWIWILLEFMFPKLKRKIRVVLIEPRSPSVNVFTRYPMPRIGLPLLATILNKLGFDCRVYCEDIASIEWEVVFAADIVGIGTLTSTAPRAYRIADKVRARGIPVIMGGVHPTFLPEEALEHSDYVVRGEGEHTLPELLEVILRGRNQGSVLGLSYCDKHGRVVHNDDRPLIMNLDSLPFPDLTTIHHHERIKLTPIVASRGCPYKCTFCSVTPMFGHKYRYRSSANVLAEIEEKDPDQIFFYDDMFNANRKRMKEILRGMIGMNIKWSAQVRTNIVKHQGKIDYEMLHLMKASGCIFLCIGLESVNPKTLEEFNKDQTLEDIVLCIKLVREAGIRVHGMFVLGSKTDDRDTMMETARFAIANEIDTVQFMILTPLPGSADFKKLDEAGRIFDRDWSLYTAHNVVYWPEGENLTAYELQVGTSEATKYFYSVTRIKEHLNDKEVVGALYLIYGRYIYERWTKTNSGRFEMLRTLPEFDGSTKAA